MDTEFDPAKNAANIAKHGVSLVDADDFEWETALVRSDVRYAYGEEHMSAMGFIGTRLHVVIFVDRGEIRRIISLRKANSREVKHYVEQT